MINDWTKLGAIVRSSRRRQGLSQADLAERAGVSRSWLTRLEGGHRGAELEPLFRLLSALGMTLLLDEPSPAQDGGESSRPSGSDAGEPATKHTPKRAKRQATTTPKTIPLKRLPRPRHDATPVELALERQIDAALVRRKGWLLAAENPTTEGHPLDHGSPEGGDG
ncbi:helix-turn-helix transcriptional regulator [Phycicoccus sp. CSK15P-2]|nr:helix-turn-helix transcriptional regulator [Phycicoccus sp. CSK15P-2]